MKRFNQKKGINVDEIFSSCDNVFHSFGFRLGFKYGLSDNNEVKGSQIKSCKLECVSCYRKETKLSKQIWVIQWKDPRISKDLISKALRRSK